MSADSLNTFFKLCQLSLYSIKQLWFRPFVIFDCSYFFPLFYLIFFGFISAIYFYHFYKLILFTFQHGTQKNWMSFFYSRLYLHYYNILLNLRFRILYSLLSIGSKLTENWTFTATCLSLFGPTLHKYRGQQNRHTHHDNYKLFK